VDAQPGHGAVPAFKDGVQLLQAVEASALEGIVFDIAAAPLGDALLLGMGGSGRERSKPQWRAKAA
jgi:hypothetical protein